MTIARLCLPPLPGTVSIRLELGQFGHTSTVMVSYYVALHWEGVGAGPVGDDDIAVIENMPSAVGIG